MALVARVLPSEEWAAKILPVWPAGWALPDAGHARMVVVERDGQVVATWAAMDVVHLHGVWKDPAARDPKIPGLLIDAMMDLLRGAGIAGVFTIAPTPEVRALAEHAGFEVLEGDLMIAKVPEVV